MLKWVAVVTMTVDHVGLVFFPECPIFRVIGRLAFPLFAYLLVLGMASTHDLRGYLNRMLFFAFVSQVPYALVNGVQPWERLNIFATLALGMGVVHLVERRSVAFVVPLAASLVVPVDYGAYGVATVLFFYLLRRNWKTGASLFMLVNLTLLITDSWYQPFAILALPLILLHDRGRLKIGGADALVRRPQFRKYFFYVYYPLHLTVLYALRLLA